MRFTHFRAAELVHLTEKDAFYGQNALFRGEKFVKYFFTADKLLRRKHTFGYALIAQRILVDFARLLAIHSSAEGLITSSAISFMQRTSSL